MMCLFTICVADIIMFIQGLIEITGKIFLNNVSTNKHIVHMNTLFDAEIVCSLLLILLNFILYDNSFELTIFT